MDSALYWFGLAHAIAYCLAGGVFVIAYTFFWAHWKTKRISPIIKWYVAKHRWDRRHTHGLTESEWQQGEPKP